VVLYSVYMNFKKGSDRRLEAFKIFPYIAWILTILFTIFVYNITLDLRDTTNQLRAETQLLQSQVNQPVNEIKDFENTKNL